MRITVFEKWLNMFQARNKLSYILFFYYAKTISKKWQLNRLQTFIFWKYFIFGSFQRRNGKPKNCLLRMNFCSCVFQREALFGNDSFSLPTIKIIYKQHLSSEAFGFPLQADNTSNFSSQSNTLDAYSESRKKFPLQTFFNNNFQFHFPLLTLNNRISKIKSASMQNEQNSYPVSSRYKDWFLQLTFRFCSEITVSLALPSLIFFQTEELFMKFLMGSISGFKV